MNINLNDEKILRIVYQLNDKEIVNFNYENGEIVSVTKDGDKEQKIDDFKKMLNITKEPDFLEKVKQLVKDASNKETSEKIEEMKVKDDSLKKAKEIIKMDKNGELDGILKRVYKNSEKYDIAEPIKVESKCDSEYSLDTSICQKSLNMIQSKLLNLLCNGEIKHDNDEFWGLIDAYQEYNKKLKELQDKEWEVRTT